MSLRCSLVIAPNLKLYIKPFTAKTFHTVFEGTVANKFICDNKATIPIERKKEAITLQKFPIIQCTQPSHQALTESGHSTSGYEQLVNLHLVSRQKDGTISELTYQNPPFLYLSCGVALIILQYIIHKMPEDTFYLDNDRDYSQTSAFSSCNEFTLGMPSSHRLLQYEEVYSLLRSL